MSSYGKRNLPMVSEYEVGKKRDFRSQVSKHRVLVVVFFPFLECALICIQGACCMSHTCIRIAVCLEGQ